MLYKLVMKTDGLPAIGSRALIRTEDIVLGKSVAYLDHSVYLHGGPG